MTARAFAAVIAIVVLASTPSAHAETRRARIALDQLPRSDVLPKIAAADAKLPDGARDGGVAPKAWLPSSNDGESMQPWHCTDGRRASVTTNGTEWTETDEIWERDGKSFLDHASVETKGGRLHVAAATRREMKSVVEGVWAYRANDFVFVVSARDGGRFDAKWAFFGCRIEENLLSLSASTITIASSPDEANEARTGIIGAAYPGAAALKKPWEGVAFRILATVSKSSADRGMMLNVVMNEP